MKFVCPSCQRTLNAKAEMAGGRAKCPSCGKNITIPSPSKGDLSDSCPGCGRSFKVRAEMAGRQAVCPACKTKFKVLADQGPSPVPARDPIPEPRPARPGPPPLPVGPGKPGLAKAVESPKGNVPDQAKVEPESASTETGIKTQVKKEIGGLIAGAVLVGGIVGYLYGGLYDPWRDQGLATAGLNMVIFGIWAAAEALGLLGAYKAGLARTRSMLILSGAVSGGFWCGLISALDVATDPIMEGSMAFNAAFGFVTGFVVCGLISGLSVIKLSKMVETGEQE